MISRPSSHHAPNDSPCSRVHIDGHGVAEVGLEFGDFVRSVNTARQDDLCAGGSEGFFVCFIAG